MGTDNMGAFIFVPVDLFLDILSDNRTEMNS